MGESKAVNGKLQDTIFVVQFQRAENVIFSTKATIKYTLITRFCFEKLPLLLSKCVFCLSVFHVTVTVGSASAVFDPCNFCGA